MGKSGRKGIQRAFHVPSSFPHDFHGPLLVTIIIGKLPSHADLLVGRKYPVPTGSSAIIRYTYLRT